MREGLRLTRRDLLCGAAVAGADVLVGPAPARAAGRPASGAPGASAAGGRVFRREVGVLGAGAVATVAVDRPFCLVGVTHARPADAHLQLRTRRADGRWGRWGPAAEPSTGEPMWTGQARELQLRSRRALDGVSLAFVAAEPAAGVGRAAAAGVGRAAGAGVGRAAAAAHGHASGAGPARTDAATPGDAALPLATPALPAGPGQPPIIARRVWAGSNHPPIHGPYYGTIEMGVVHHTENPNGYSAAEVPALLRAIYEFHIHGRGWFDIGYNYVVDRFGRIWEARQGGVDLPVSGAQAGDWNEISFGVALLGTYTDALPSAAALAAVQRLLAWKMALTSRPVIGEIAETVAAEGVRWTQFRVGQHVRFPRIAGHRDVDATDCPGDALYRHLPAMRPRVARLAGMPAMLALDAQLTAVTGSAPALLLSGRFASRDGSPIPSAPIAIETVVGRQGETVELTTVTTDPTGRFAATIPATGPLLLRALHAAPPACVSDLIAYGDASGAAPASTAAVRRPATAALRPTRAARGR